MLRMLLSEIVLLEHYYIGVCAYCVLDIVNNQKFNESLVFYPLPGSPLISGTGNCDLTYIWHYEQLNSGQKDGIHIDTRIISNAGPPGRQGYQF